MSGCQPDIKSLTILVDAASWRNIDDFLTEIANITRLGGQGRPFRHQNGQRFERFLSRNLSKTVKTRLKPPINQE